MIQEWFLEKFVSPLCHYYTLEATLLYGIILGLSALGVYKLFMKLKIKIDKNFLYAMIPFIIYGGWTRALRDHFLGIYSTGWWWCSPPIYLMIFLITIGSLLFSIFLEKTYNISYYKTTIGIGSLLLLYNLSLTQISNWYAILAVFSIVTLWAIIFFGIHRFKPKILSLENAGLLTAHLLDASATFTALTYFGYHEQHVLPSFLIGIFGPWIMFPLKITVVSLVLYLIDTNMKKGNMRNLLKIIILILGLALGIRDMLTIAL